MASTSTSASASHLRKRQFQPSITSYFAACDADSQTHPVLQRQRSTLSPPLPEETQASLLSVGMRVRKSVPEGYKTHKTLGTYAAQPTASTAPPRPSQSRPDRGHGRELMPFCGLHKTGGWAVQEIPPSSAPAVLQTGSDEDYGSEEMPGLSLSQTTRASTQNRFHSSGVAMPGSSRKRTYEEEVEHDLDAYFDTFDAANSQPLSTMPSDRPMARLKFSPSRMPVQPTAQALEDADFEEAAFLAPMDVDDRILR